MTPFEMLKEWGGGCTCAGPMFDRMNDNRPGTTNPAKCEPCTQGLIEALESHFREKNTDSLPSRGSHAQAAPKNRKQSARDIRKTNRPKGKKP